MPYIKPENMIYAQVLSQKALDEDLGFDTEVIQAAGKIKKICPVCGDFGCSKMVVKANGVYVHPEDVDDAEPIERGEIP